MSKYYIAYGSNLNREQMDHRCANAKKIGFAYLEGYQLLFRGRENDAKLTIEKKDGSRVPVGIYELDEFDIRRLDVYEGNGYAYIKQEMTVISGGGTRLKVFTYVMCEGRKLNLPSEEYYQRCQKGYEDFGFDLAYLEKARQISEEHPNQDSS